MTQDSHLTPAEAAARYRLSKATIYRLIRARELPAIRIGGQYRIPTTALEDFEREARSLTSKPAA